MGTATPGSIPNTQPHPPSSPIKKNQCDVTLSLTRLQSTKYQRFSYLTEIEGHYMRLVLDKAPSNTVSVARLHDLNRGALHETYLDNSPSNTVSVARLHDLNRGALRETGLDMAPSNTVSVPRLHELNRGALCGTYLDKAPSNTVSEVK